MTQKNRIEKEKEKPGKPDGTVEGHGIPLVRGVTPFEQAPNSIAEVGRLAETIIERKNELQAERERFGKAAVSFRMKELETFFDQGCDLNRLREFYKQLGLWKHWQQFAGLDDDSVNRWIRLAESAIEEYGSRESARERLVKRFTNFTQACQHYGIPTGGKGASGEIVVRRTAKQLEKLELTKVEKSKVADLKQQLANIIAQAERLSRQLP